MSRYVDENGFPYDDCEVEQTLTDNEIIKALECCRCDDGDLSNCEDCPLVECKNIFVCHSKLSTNALDLINRQKAEISVKNKLLDIAEAKFEKIRAEAYKEFVEELKATGAGGLDYVTASYKKLDILVEKLIEKETNK